MVAPAHLAQQLGIRVRFMAAHDAWGASAGCLAQHAAWGYFARAYDLEQIAVISHGSGDGGAARLAEVIDRARAAGIRTVFVQPQFSTEAARMVAREIGAGIRPLDPLRRDPLEALGETAEAVLEATAP